MATLFGREIDLLCLDLDDRLITTEAGAPRRFDGAARVIHRIRPKIEAQAIVEATTRGLEVDPNCGQFVNFLSDLGISAAREIQVYFESMPGYRTIRESS